MKNIFIVNPAAGPTNCTEYIRQLLTDNAGDYDWELYETKCPGDAMHYVRRVAAATDEPIRFFACGGDGTLNNVINGAVGFDNVSVGVFPCGSGNDYVKHFGGAKPFLDVKALLSGKDFPVDIMKIGNRYAINVVNLGFDAEACNTMNQVRRKKIIGGANSYVTGVLKALATSMKTACSVAVDGESLPHKAMMLCNMACGSFYGGAFNCAPNSRCSDGFMEFCLVSPISRIRFLTLVDTFKKGGHLVSKGFSDCLTYCRCKTVHITSPGEFTLCMDGEITHVKEFSAEILHRAIRFILPDGAKEVTSST